MVRGWIMPFIYSDVYLWWNARHASKGMLCRNIYTESESFYAPDPGRHISARSMDSNMRKEVLSSPRIGYSVALNWGDIYRRAKIGSCLI